MTAQDLKGIFTALSVPFNSEGEVDRFRFNDLIKLQAKEGADGLVVHGTTGESPCLSLKEQEELFIWAFEGSKFEQHVIAGIGGNSTRKVIEYKTKPFLMGASAFLAVVPYYNRPPQRGLIKHFETLADGKTPIILYNVPARTGQSLTLKSIVELSEHPNIIGIKEASGDLKLGKQIMEQTDPEEFSVLSGDDETGFELCAMGANGIVSVISNIIVREMKELFKRIKTGSPEEQKKALKAYEEQYGSLLKAVYTETNPIGIKMALKQAGIFKTAKMRLPLVEMEEEDAQKLQSVLQEHNLTHRLLEIVYSD